MLAFSGMGCGGDDDGGGDDFASPVRWVSLGDSFSSGVGVRDTEGDCKTSDLAYAPVAAAALTAELPVEEYEHLACTGARIADIVTQLASAPADTNLVTLAAGGNDIGFFKVGADCMGGDDLMRRGCDVTPDELAGRIAMIEDDLASLYERAERVVGGDGLVVVIGYPQLIDDPDVWPDDVGDDCGALSTEDVEVLRATTDLLDDTIATLVTRFEDVRFLDPRAAFVGHARCGDQEPWINGIFVSTRTGLSPFSGSFHPNEVGYAALADLLEELLRDAYA
ncbi:MAG: GDSL-type esterase/lipase family protein [Actinomycetota bacterium]